MKIFSKYKLNRNNFWKYLEKILGWIWFGVWITLLVRSSYAPGAPNYETGQIVPFNNHGNRNYHALVCESTV